MNDTAQDKYVKEMVLKRVYEILKNPRVNAYTPQSLVEIVCSLLSLSFDKRKMEKRMFKQYGGNRPWWLNGDLDYPTAVNRLGEMVEFLENNIR